LDAAPAPVRVQRLCSQVVDVVRQKVREIAAKTWKRPDVEHVSLYRAFQRLFNRLLANRGQGLWDCLVNDRFVHHSFSIGGEFSPVFVVKNGTSN